jgi:hypothetical protein
MNDPDFETLYEAWVHLTPWQKKMLVWRAWIESIRNRAFRFVQTILRRSNDE